MAANKLRNRWKTVDVTLYLVDERERSNLYALARPGPKGEHPGMVSIPRSLLMEIEREEVAAPDSDHYLQQRHAPEDSRYRWPRCVLRIPKWKAKELKLEFKEEE